MGTIEIFAIVEDGESPTADQDISDDHEEDEDSKSSIGFEIFLLGLKPGGTFYSGG